MRACHGDSAPCLAVPSRAVSCRAEPCIVLPCCAVLCCAVLCCAVLCCAVLCCAVLWYGVPCRCAVLWCGRVPHTRPAPRTCVSLLCCTRSIHRKDFFDTEEALAALLRQLAAATEAGLALEARCTLAQVCVCVAGACPRCAVASTPIAHVLRDAAPRTAGAENYCVINPVARQLPVLPSSVRLCSRGTPTRSSRSDTFLRRN
jgi:hypothetical protein